mmetsp:Transcript_98070/g.299791  ORF Transcript_98070/g.299791 Transcript_98070/m.299791 type:complete len:218 (+) Transcript_98070:371-1024(+)
MPRRSNGHLTTARCHCLPKRTAAILRSAGPLPPGDDDVRLPPAAHAAASDVTTDARDDKDDDGRNEEAQHDEETADGLPDLPAPLRRPNRGGTRHRVTASLPVLEEEGAQFANGRASSEEESTTLRGPPLLGVRAIVGDQGVRTVGRRHRCVAVHNIAVLIVLDVENVTAMFGISHPYDGVFLVLHLESDLRHLGARRARDNQEDDADEGEQAAKAE